MPISKIGINISHQNNNNQKYKNYTPNFKSKFQLNTNKKTLKDSIKIVFSDIDGTISAHSDEMTKNTIKAMEQLHKSHIPVILTTARCYLDTLPIIEQFSHRPDFTIVLQGGELIDSKGNALFRNKVTPQAGKKLIKWFKSVRKNDKNSHLIMYFDEQPYSTSNIQFPWKARTLIRQVNSFDELFNKGKVLQKAVIYKTDTKNCPNYNQNSIVESFYSFKVPDLEVRPSSSSVLEFQNKWVSKDKAIDFLLRLLKIKPKEAMVIGDSSNDIEMMDFIRKQNGMAVAMGNASDAVKQHANATTTSVHQDGFANAIKNLFTKIN